MTVTEHTTTARARRLAEALATSQARRRRQRRKARSRLAPESAHHAEESGRRH